MKINMVRTLDGWKPGDDEAVRVSRRWKAGEVCRADFTKPREHRSLRRYWGLVKLVYENSEQFKSMDAVHQYLKIRCGHCTQIVSASTGEIFLVADSIDYDTLNDEAAFQEVWRRVVDVVCKDILPGISENELEYEVLKCCGLAGGGR